MAGRVRRKTGLAQAAARGAQDTPPAACALCERELGTQIEWHHLVPKSRGGTDTVPVHPICHRTIHACLTNQELAAHFAGMTALRGHADIARFIRWIASKPPDFNAPTRKAR